MFLNTYISPIHYTRISPQFKPLQNRTKIQIEIWKQQNRKRKENRKREPDRWADAAQLSGLPHQATLSHHLPLCCVADRWDPLDKGEPSSSSSSLWHARHGTTGAMSPLEIGMARRPSICQHFALISPASTTSSSTRIHAQSEHCCPVASPSLPPQWHLH
jgi:hypothetical protein